MPHQLLCTAVLLLNLTVAGALPAGEAWPEFRGPTGDGHAADSNPPTNWFENSDVRWKVKVPGRGWSTPVVSDDRIWLTSATEDGHEMFVLCLDRKDGRTIFNRTVFEIEKPEPRNKLNSYASPSPLLADGNVYVNYGTYGVACLDGTTGKTLWKRTDINLDHQEGPGSSMIRYRDRLIFHCDGRDRQYLISLDRKTGDTVWRKTRSLDLSHVGDFARKAFTTPLVVKTKKGDRLISPAAQGCYCYDPVDGREIWSLKYHGFSAVPRPVVFEDLVFVVNDFARPAIHAVRLGGEGDITKTHVVWKHTQNGPATTSPVVVNGRLLFVSDKGIVTCLDARSGKQLWRERLGGNFCASPIVAGGLVYFFSRAGHSSVVKPRVAGGMHEVARNVLDEGLMASPAVAGDSLFLRTTNFLYCIEEVNADAGG